MRNIQIYASCMTNLNFEYYFKQFLRNVLEFLDIGFRLFCVSSWVSCLNYDPYCQSYSGFIGGKSETAFLLIVFTCLMWSTLLMLCYVFSTHMSSVIPKTTLVLNWFCFLNFWLNVFPLLLGVVSYFAVIRFTSDHIFCITSWSFDQKFEQGQSCQWTRLCRQNNCFGESFVFKIINKINLNIFYWSFTHFLTW